MYYYFIMRLKETMKSLFDEIRINNLLLRNRFVRSATWEKMADQSGNPTEKLIQLYEELSVGGSGLIITGAAVIAKEATRLPGMLSFHKDSDIDLYRKMIQAVHRHGSSIILQCAFAGEKEAWWAPADSSVSELKRIADSFGKAAERARNAGFDGVQIHAAHGYFLSSFLSAAKNGRTDEYGRTPENRIRFLAEICESVRKHTGKNFTVLVKINSFDEEGYPTFDMCRIACKRLSEIGIDAVEISGGSGQIGDFEDLKYTESVFRDFALKVAAENDLRVILVGQNRSFSTMTELLNSTGIEMFSLSRPLVCESNIVNLWKKNNSYKSRCVSCNQCFSLDGKNCIYH